MVYILIEKNLQMVVKGHVLNFIIATK